jgi:hypothetical protein
MRDLQWLGTSYDVDGTGCPTVEGQPVGCAMLIGDVAAATGVSTKTLRFYEREALLPEPDRLPNGYRDYEPPPSGVLRSSDTHKASGSLCADPRHPRRPRWRAATVRPRRRARPPAHNRPRAADRRTARHARYAATPRASRPTARLVRWRPRLLPHPRGPVTPRGNHDRWNTEAGMNRLFRPAANVRDAAGATALGGSTHTPQQTRHAHADTRTHGASRRSAGTHSPQLIRARRTSRRASRSCPKVWLCRWYSSLVAVRFLRMCHGCAMHRPVEGDGRAARARIAAGQRTYSPPSWHAMSSPLVMSRSGGSIPRPGSTRKHRLTTQNAETSRRACLPAGVIIVNHDTVVTHQTCSSACAVPVHA